MLSRPARKPGVNWVVVDGDVVAVDPSTDAVHVLQGAASVVWQLLDGEPIDGLAGIVADECGVDVNTVEPDVEAAISLIERAELMQR